jgi:hypothetical protein
VKPRLLQDVKDRYDISAINPRLLVQNSTDLATRRSKHLFCSALPFYLGAVHSITGGGPRRGLQVSEQQIADGFADLFSQESDKVYARQAFQAFSAKPSVAPALEKAASDFE